MGAQNKKPTWADEQIRLDPYALPQKMTFNRASEVLSARSRSQTAGAEVDTSVEFTLDTNGAVMKRRLNCGLPLTMALPNKAFGGVAARAYENEDGTTTVTLELLHHDTELSVPLCVSDTVEDAAADWHSWAKRFGLPMLLIDTQGFATVVKDHSGISSQDPKPRRRRASFVQNRPKFMRRRKVGMVGPIERIQAREIIARN